MRKPVKLVALDLDGTTLDSAYRIPPANHEAICDLLAAGILPVLATGRRFRIGACFAEALGLPGPMILQNGAITKQVGTRMVLQCRFIESAIVRRVIRQGHLAGFSPVVTCNPESPGELLVENCPARYRALGKYLESGWNDITLADDLEQIRRSDVLQIMYCGTVDEMHRLAGRLRPCFEGALTIVLTEYPRRDLSILDIMEGRVSKGSALRHLAGLLQIPMDEVLAVGDNFNDRHMLEAAGQAMIMGNADPSLQLEFPCVLPSNDEAGVAWGIWTHVLPMAGRLSRWFPPPPPSETVGGTGR